MTSQVGAETSHSEWEADGFQLPARVTSAFGWPGRLTLDVEGRRVPVVGRLTRDDHGDATYVPTNVGSNRADDRALLDAVAELVGLTASIPRKGRPSGGASERACQWIDARPADVSRMEAVEKAAVALGWATDSMLRRYRRWRRDQIGDQR